MDVPAQHSALGLSARGEKRGWPAARLLGLPAALAAAVLVILPLALRTRVAEYDEAVLLDAARNIQRAGLPLRSIGASGVPLLEHTSLYAYLLSLYAPATGENLALARGVTALAALLCVYLTYRIAAALGGRRAGLLAAAFVALNPFLAVYAYFVRMEMFMALAVLVALYLLVRRSTPRLRDCLAAGLVLALATLFKEFALVVVPPAAVYAMATAGPTARTRIAAAGALAAPPLLALGGWALWAYSLWPGQLTAALGRWVNSASGSSIVDPRMLTGNGVWARLLADDLFGPGLALGLLVAAAWAILGRGKRDGRVALLWAYLLFALGLSLLVRLREPRHLIALVPVAAILVGLALAEVWRAALHAGTGRAALAVSVIGLLLLLGGPWRLSASDSGLRVGLAHSYRERLNSDAHYALLARAGQEAARLSAPGALLTVAHQGHVIAYYADRRYLMLYVMNEPAIQAALAKADLLVWDEPTWLALPADRVPAIEARVAADFVPAAEVRDRSRVVTIYRRKQ